MLTTLLETAAAWPAPVVLVAACAILVAESGTLVGMALPGSTLLVALGLWSLGTPQALVPAVAASALGTVAGTHLGWWRGRTRPHVTRLPGPLSRMAERRVAQASAWLAQRRGPAAALLLACGHWAAAARPVVPRVAGAAGVPYRIAGPALVGSGTAWAATIVLLGNRVGALVLSSAAWVPAVLVALLVLVLVLHSRRRRGSSERRTASGHRSPPVSPPSRPSARSTLQCRRPTPPATMPTLRADTGGKAADAAPPGPVRAPPVHRSSRPLVRSRNRDNAGGARSMVWLELLSD